MINDKIYSYLIDSLNKNRESFREALWTIFDVLNLERSSENIDSEFVFVYIDSTQSKIVDYLFMKYWFSLVRELKKIFISIYEKHEDWTKQPSDWNDWGTDS